ncbi:MAG TPA: pitrilysin family protein, partial [Gemmatimonadaceae bacterium]|nr:pitrilysin family protein [Gemmatimonadaceae bacterium]
FEHMMFQGSENVKKAEHFQYVQRAGGSMNGTTAEDRTNYFQALPSNRLNLGLWLEADRMRSLAITDSNFANQREAVKEERRLRVDNQPYGTAIFEHTYALYDSATCFPYSHSVIGSMDDLNAAETKDVQAFFDMYYAPNNATLVVAGDFKTADAKRLIEQYFAGIPRGAEPPPVACEPNFNSGARTRHVHDAQATLPASIKVYRIPAYDHADYPALELLATIFGQGESSRMNRELVRDAKAAAQAVTLLNPFGPRRGPGVFLTLAVANQGVKLDSLDGLVAQEVGGLVSAGVTAEELNKAKNIFRANAITSRQMALQLAEVIQRATMFLGSPDAINSELERYEKVTIGDLQRVARTYLTPDNSLTLLVSSEVIQ